MITRVAIALVAHQDSYLVGQRGPDGPLPAYHEFPGGKCLPDETPEACAVRECWEETGLRVQVVRLRHESRHLYPHDTVHLHFFDCRLIAECDPMDVNPDFRWVGYSRLRDYRFPEANRQIVVELSGSEPSDR